jgi:hypothetical protein
LLPQEGLATVSVMNSQATPTKEVAGVGHIAATGRIKRITSTYKQVYYEIMAPISDLL